MTARAKEPKRLWVIEAADHGVRDERARFDARLQEGIAWVTGAACQSR